MSTARPCPDLGSARSLLLVDGFGSHLQPAQAANGFSTLRGFQADTELGQRRLRASAAGPSVLLPLTPGKHVWAWR